MIASNKEKIGSMPELISPAGDWPSLNSAVESGADAVYFGLKDMNMRFGAGNFDILELKKVMTFLHKASRRGYLTLNSIVYNGELDKVKRMLNAAVEAGVDAVILWDMAVLSIAKELGLDIHLSTQASVSNINALKQYADLGVSRVVLARECSLSDIKAIIVSAREGQIACDIEVFIHGAMCLSISGRCLLSHEAFRKSANRGECIQPCRREFTIVDECSESKYRVGEDYILSAKDLCSIEFLDKLVGSGIAAFKIEGRMRSPEYVSVVTSAYRRAIDSIGDGTFDGALKKELMAQIRRTYNRGFSTGFYFGKSEDFCDDLSQSYKKVYVGEVEGFYKRIGVAKIIVRNETIHKGQKILISGKKTPANFAEINEMEIEHIPVSSAEKGESVGVKLPFAVCRNDKVFLWLET